MKRNLYLSIQKKEEAKQNFLKRFEHQLPEVETISVFESLHRVTAEAIYAKDSSPSYNSCAMDGIAVISSHTVTASLQNPCLLKEGVDYIEVDTGDRIELPYDAVIMAEDLIEQEQGYQIIEPTHPFKHVRAIGEDIVSQEMLIPSYHTIRAIDSSVLLSAGVLEIKVLKQPIVALIPTGDEMIDCCEPLQKDKIRETNSWMFENLVKEHQGTVLRFPIVADDPNQIEQVLLEAARKADVVIMNAGSSAGRDDYSVHAIRKLGEVFTHGVAIKPGKPVILGQILGKPVIGLPGYPVSAYLTFMEFVVPLLRQMMRQVNEKKDCIQATITKNIMSSLKYEEYVRVKLGIVHDRLIATPLERGAGASMSLVRADGFCVIPQNKEGVLAGETVTVQLVNAYEQIQKTVVVIGSHDLILDVINDQMMTQQVNGCLSSTHVGSLAGLVALKKRETHLAPTHLLDETSGIYNQAIIKELFNDEPMMLIKGVKRVQGLIVEKGNPKQIHSLNDLTQKITFINRQKGSGTRVLLDYELKKQGIDSNDIQGYEHEVMTHMAVAVAVKEGNADVGLGVYSAAKALDLDFIELADEEYDFALHKEDYELPNIQSFLQVLTSDELKQKLDALGGYRYDEIGKVIDL